MVVPFVETLNFGSDSGIVWFITLYSSAAYFKRYEPHKGWKKSKILILYAITALITPLGKFCVDLLIKSPVVLLFNERTIKGASAYVFYRYNSVFVLTASLCLFMVFLNMDIKSLRVNKAISFFAPLTFGVYLIHDNPSMRNWIWRTVNITGRLYKPYFILYIIAVAVGIFILCAFIEFGRKKLMSGIENGAYLDRLCGKIQGISNKIINNPYT
jgi:hypothetical protein